MSNEGSLQTGADFAFDLDSQKGVTILLASVRAAAISTEDKNELRDLIFLYSNGGKDRSVKITIEQKVAAHSITPIAKSQSEKKTAQAKSPKKPKHKFGASRPSPSFTPTFKSATKAETKTPVQTSKKAEKPHNKKAHLRHSPNEDPIEPFHKVEPAAKPAASNAKVAVPTPSQPNPEPPAVTPPAPKETPAPVAQQTATQPVVKPEPAPQPAPAETSPATDSASSLQRIREIKSLVNDKVGNPVNLVDIDNEVGREYMGALLDAMKKINSGSSATSAMKRLEDSYKAVELTIEKHKNDPVKAEPAPQPEPAPVPKEAPVVKIPTMSEPASQPVATASPSPSPTPEPVEKIPISKIPLTKNPKVVSDSSKSVSKLQDVLVKPDPAPAPTAQSVSRPEPVVPQPTPAPTPQPASVAPVSQPQAEPAKETRPESRIPITKVSSLAQSVSKPKSIEDLPAAASLESSSVAGDDLFTKQVDDGLNQLLGEWVIFKKSGLFGTGPNGVEHPLFKTVANVQIPLLLAGRFEGATQEIKQSITDYMNGWRYEQGIVYEQDETFEHYLRRVIRHILNLQK